MKLGSYDDLVENDIRADTQFARAFLAEAGQILIQGEFDVARTTLRHLVKGTIGYAKLAKATGLPEKSLIRMLGPKGNPQANNLLAVFKALQSALKVRMEVRAVAVPARRRAA